MTKGLEELSYIKENHLQLAKEKYRKLEPKALEDVLTRKAKHYDIIEKELKDKEQQDSALKTLKEVIAFGKKLPDIEIDDDGNIECIIGAVGFTIQRQMENKERELLRKWVLETCFPKELKALEIIKKKRVEVNILEDCETCEEYNDFIKHRVWFQEEYTITQEEYNLLKEVLL